MSFINIIKNRAPRIDPWGTIIFLLKNSIITPHQSGFTPGDSAINQLLSLTNEFGKALDEGKEIRVVFCDISKAFDRV
jgi:hypothetical protein